MKPGLRDPSGSRKGSAFDSTKSIGICLRRGHYGGFGPFGDIFGTISRVFSGANAGPPGALSGGEHGDVLSIFLEDAFSGVERDVFVPGMRPVTMPGEWCDRTCQELPLCSGDRAGRDQQGHPCTLSVFPMFRFGWYRVKDREVVQQLRWSGEIAHEAQVEVRVASGVDSGTRLG